MACFGNRIKYLGCYTSCCIIGILKVSTSRGQMWEAVASAGLSSKPETGSAGVAKVCKGMDGKGWDGMGG